MNDDAIVELPPFGSPLPDHDTSRAVCVPVSGIGLGNRVKAQVVDASGAVVHETPWGPNLILEQGMNNVATLTLAALFTHCAVGTGNTATTDDSGAVTATTSGTTCTSSGAFFAAGDVGKLLVFDTGEHAKITVFNSTTSVTLASSLGVGGATLFALYRIAQVGLATELKRSATYLTGSSNCFTTRSGNVLTHQRTYDFTAETGTVNYAEVGFSNTATVAANLNMRALFAGGAVTVLATQQIRVIYQMLVTLEPDTVRAKTAVITGWPSLEQAVTADSGTNLFTLAAHGFYTDMPLSFTGTTAPSPLVLGTTYYARDILTNTFGVAAAPAGAQIDLTTNGTAVKVKTNVDGDEQRELVGMSSVNSAGATSTFDGGTSCAEPGSTTTSLGLATVATAHNSFASTPPNRNTNASSGSATLDTYTANSLTRTKSLVFAVGTANRSDWRVIIVWSTGADPAGSESFGFIFKTLQEKDSLHTLTIKVKWTWDWKFV
jgi:hypothetical protein